MYKLRKIVLGSIGHDASWHDKTSIDFTIDNVPSHSLAALLNGGGKSSLISLFFSVFKPNQKHFLYKKNGDGVSLEDYYDQDVPGYIATEWEFRDAKQSTLSMPGMDGRKHILGSVGLKDARGFTRLFFSVKNKEGLGWEQLPYPVGDAVADFATALELRQWFQRQSQVFGADFLVFDMQDRWLEHLSSELNFNLHDFDIHMRMNAVEGGLVEFLKPLAETNANQYDRDFMLLKIVMDLVLRESALQESVANLNVLAGELREAPAARRAIEALTPLYEKTAKIARKSEDVAQAQEKISRLASDARLMVDKSEAYGEALVSENAAKEEVVKSLTPALADLRVSLKGKEVDSAATNLALSEISLLEANARKTEAEQRLVTSRTECQEWNATERYFPVVQRRRDLQSILDQIANESAGQDAYKMMTRLGSSILISINREGRLVDDRIKTASSLLDKTKQSLRVATEKRKEFDQKYQSKLTEIASLNGAIDVAESRLADIQKKFRIVEGQELQAALNTVNREIARIDRRVNEFEEQKKTLSGEGRTLSLKKQAAESSLLNMEQQIKGMQARISAYNERVARLLSSSDMSEIAGDADILSPQVRDAISRQVEGSRDRREQIVRQKDALTRALQTVEEYGISGVPQHVRIVEDFFKNHSESLGDVSVDPTVSHVAKSPYYDPDILKKNPVLVHSLVCSDVEKCKSILNDRGADIHVDLPVFLLSMGDVKSPSNFSYSHAVFPSDHWMSLSSASGYKVAITQDIKDVEGKISTVDARIKRFNELLLDIHALETEFSDQNSISSLKESVAKMTTDTADFPSQIKIMEERLRTIQVEDESATKEMVLLAGQRDSLRVDSTEISLFLKNEWPVLTNKRDILSKEKVKLSEIQASLQAAKESIPPFEAMVKEITATLEKESINKSSLDEFSSQISYSDPEINEDVATPIINLADALTDYASMADRFKNSAYRSLLADKEAAEKGVEDARKNFKTYEKSENRAIDHHRLEENIKQFVSSLDVQADIIALRAKSEANRDHIISEIGSLISEIEACNKARGEASLTYLAIKKTHRVDSSFNFEEISKEDLLSMGVSLSHEIVTLKRDIAIKDADLVAAQKAINELSIRQKTHSTISESIDGVRSRLELLSTTHASSSVFFDENLSKLESEKDFIGANKLLNASESEISSVHSSLMADFDKQYDELRTSLEIARAACREIPPRAISDKALMLNPAQSSQVASIIKDLIGAFKNKLESTAPVRKEAISLLSDFINNGQRIVKYMSSAKNRLPHSVRYVGDKQILVAKKSIPRGTSPEEMSRSMAVCGRILDNIAEGQMQILSGIELSVTLMKEMYPKELFPRGFDFHLVKMSDLPGNDYVPLARLSFSGGERAVSAFFLYLLIQSVRSEFYSESMTKGGYIILDNPFANVTRADFIRAITEMATQANYQIIAFTGIKDPSLVPYFKNRIYLTTKRAKSMGKTKKVIRQEDFKWRGDFVGAA